MLLSFPCPHSLCVHAYFHLFFYHVLFSELPFRLLINCLYCLIWVRVLDFGGSGRVSYGVPGCTGTIKEWCCGRTAWPCSLPVPSWPERARCGCRLAWWGRNWEGMFCVLVVNLRARGTKKGNGQCWRQRGQPDSQSPCPSLGKSGLRG